VSGATAGLVHACAGDVEGMGFSRDGVTARRLRSLRSLMVVNGMIGLALVLTSLVYEPTPPHAALRWTSIVAVFVGLGTLLGWTEVSLSRRALATRAIPGVAVALGLLTCGIAIALAPSYAETLAFPVELVPASAVVVLGVWGLRFTVEPERRRSRERALSRR
jgi:hypothetical protein